MKNIFYALLVFAFIRNAQAQQNYCDFEGIKVVSFGAWNGILDSMALNPARNDVDSSMHCAKYIRDTATFDNIKLYLYTKAFDVSPYASNAFSAPHLQFKLYTSAPVGTYINLQLGIGNDDSYPAGVNSEYIAVTSKRNAWETITFSYLQSPQGSMVGSGDVDKVVLLFHPNSSARDTFYFDDVIGPALTNNTGIANSGPAGLSNFKLFQNNPNPSKELTHINFQLNHPGFVSLKLYDPLGNPVSVLLAQHMKAGTYSVPVETQNMANGIYFYVLKEDEISRTMKMIIDK